MLNHVERNNLRKLLKASRKYHLYNILSVIRGPDDKADREWKPITIAIRKYVGFHYKNCSGTVYGNYFGLKPILQRFMALPISEDNHYQFHLRKAIESIGIENLRKVDK